MKNIKLITALAFAVGIGQACSATTSTTTTTTNGKNGNTTTTTTTANANSAANTAANTNSTASAADSKVTIESVTMMRDDGSGKPGETVTSFKPADKVQYFKAALSESESGTKVKAVWTAVDADGQKNVKIVDQEVVTKAMENTVNFDISLPTDFPKGDYKADFYINDKLVKTTDYKVE